MDVFLPILHAQVQKAGFQRLVILGNTVAKALFGETAEIKNLRGGWLQWAGLPVRAGYHPLAARRRPNLLPLLVEDLAAAAAGLEQDSG